MELNLRSWLQAARPAAQINLVLPLILGQLLAYKLNGAFSFAMALPLAYYSFAMHLYIVFWNDWADHHADRQNQHPTIFSGGSRVLPDGLLTPRDLFIAGALAVFLVLSLGVVFTLRLDRPWTLLLFGAGTFLLWAYSIPPLRLNYRGGGEILQAVGVGLLLPHIAYYAQSNTFTDSTYLLPYCLHQVAAAIAFTLPDTDADKAAGKRTLATLIGRKHAAEFTLFLGVISQFILFFTTDPHGFILSPLNLPSLSLLLSFFILPALKTHKQPQNAEKKSRKYTLLFTSLTIATGALYIVGIFLSDTVQ